MESGFQLLDTRQDVSKHARCKHNFLIFVKPVETKSRNKVDFREMEQLVANNSSTEWESIKFSVLYALRNLQIVF